MQKSKTNSITNLKLAVCQLYNPILHGNANANVNANINAYAVINPEPVYGHYLALDVFSPTSAYNETPYGFIEQWNMSH